MDALDLIARENEFKKLNKQLEKKTEMLMKEIENSMQKEDIFSEFSRSLTSPTHRPTRRHCCVTQTDIATPTETNKKNRPQSKNKMEKRSNLESNSKSEFNSNSENGTQKDEVKGKSCNCCIVSDDCKDVKDLNLEFLYAFVSVSVKDNIMPQSFLKDKVTTESVCKFLSAKVKLLQDQIDKLQSTIDKKLKQCERHMTQVAELESERLTLINRANSMKCETADAMAKYAVMRNKFNEKDLLYKEQRSSTDRLTSEVKNLKSKNVSLEARCASQEEVISNLKQQLDIAKMSEKEFRDSTRSLSASHQNTIARLEAKIKSLTTHTDKQTSLIDNLRKQNALLLTEGALKVLENNYCEFLNQGL